MLSKNCEPYPWALRSWDTARTDVSGLSSDAHGTLGAHRTGSSLGSHLADLALAALVTDSAGLAADTHGAHGDRVAGETDGTGGTGRALVPVATWIALHAVLSGGAGGTAGSHGTGRADLTDHAGLTGRTWHTRGSLVADYAWLAWRTLKDIRKVNT